MTDADKIRQSQSVVIRGVTAVHAEQRDAPQHGRQRDKTDQLHNLLSLNVRVSLLRNEHVAAWPTSGCPAVCSRRGDYQLIVIDSEQLSYWPKQRRHVTVTRNY